MALTSETLNVVSVMLGKGDDMFQARFDYPTAARPTSLIVADFNGDGKLDLAVADGAAAMPAGEYRAGAAGYSCHCLSDIALDGGSCPIFMSMCR